MTLTKEDIVKLLDDSKIKYEIIPLSRPVKESDEVITCFRDGQVTLRKIIS